MTRLITLLRVQLYKRSGNHQHNAIVLSLAPHLCPIIKVADDKQRTISLCLIIIQVKLSGFLPCRKVLDKLVTFPCRKVLTREKSLLCFQCTQNKWIIKVNHLFLFATFLVFFASFLPKEMLRAKWNKGKHLISRLPQHSVSHKNRSSNRQLSNPSWDIIFLVLIPGDRKQEYYIYKGGRCAGFIIYRLQHTRVKWYKTIIFLFFSFIL